MDEIENYKRKKFHMQKVNMARLQGDKKLSQTMYDPDAIVFGTRNMGQSIYSKNNAKQLQMNHERCQEIERSNRLLLERMMTLAQKPHFSTGKFPLLFLINIVAAAAS